VFTDGQTDGQKEKSITIYLASSFHSLGGYKHRITQTTAQDSPGTLVFWYQNLGKIWTGVGIYRGAPNAGGQTVFS